MSKSLHAVTGAFGYSGKYIARRLLSRGQDVITLTNSPDRANDFGGAIRAYPLCFNQPEDLVQSLSDVKVLYNTYWVRFNHRLFTFEDAVRNTMILFDAAQRAGVERIVHVSITHPSEDSGLGYFKGKARLERALREIEIPHSILRPTVIFGGEDILINNIAWALRHLPVFGVFGDGNYRLQPIFVEDLAELAVHHGGVTGNEVVNAIGPETFTYRELASMIAQTLGLQRPIIGIPPWLGFSAGWALGKILGDVMITWEEIQGLMHDLLYVEAPPAGSTRLTAWVSEHASTLGVWYASEMERRVDRTTGYKSN
jgi:uncharacterized protein YbjT (DUF2867 family)